MGPLSNDAKACLLGWFMAGEKATLSYFEEGGQSRLTKRGRAAFNELVAGGFVTRGPDTRCLPGKTIMQGTRKGREEIQRNAETMAQFMLETRDDFSVFEPNPEFNSND